MISFKYESIEDHRSPLTTFSFDNDFSIEETLKDNYPTVNDTFNCLQNINDSRINGLKERNNFQNTVKLDEELDQIKVEIPDTSNFESYGDGES